MRIHSAACCTCGSLCSNADRLQSAQHQERAVEVVHAPASEPASVRLLLAQDELDSLLDALVLRAYSHSCASISSMRPVMSTVGGSSIALWSANGMYWKIIFVLSLSKLPQPPFLHCIANSQFNRALRHLVLIALARIVHLVQRQQNLRRIIDIRDKTRC